MDNLRGRVDPLARTLGERLAQFARVQPEAIFCTFLARGESRDITFAQLYERSLAYAAAYAREGVAPGDLVVIILDHSPHLFYSCLGAMLAGAIPSFMPPASPKQRPDLYRADHERLFARIEPRLIVTDTGAFDGFPTLAASDQLLNTPSAIAPVAANPDDVACLQHSSGTTGFKKGVRLTHRAILAQIDAYARALDFGSDDVIASWLPLYHDMGFVACFLTTVARGTRLIALDPFEWTARPTILFDAIERYRATFCWQPNFAFAHLVNAARANAHWDLSSIRAFVGCSEPNKPATFERFAQRFAADGVTRERLAVCYALAENVFAATQTQPGVVVRVAEADGFPNGVLSCGRPVEGVEVAIHDGEVALRGPFLFDGYYRDPQTTGERLRDGWLYTRDLGFMHDGELYVTGRADDVLVIAGRNFPAGELEAIAESVPGVLPGRTVAIAVDDTRTGSTALVLLVERDVADDATLRRAVRTALDQGIGLAPLAVVPLARGRLVKTTSGKLARAKNRALYLAGEFAQGGPDVKPD